MSIENYIAPFKLVSHDTGASVILAVGKYKAELFETRAEEGFEGNGYDWASLAAVFLSEKTPHLEEVIHFDPEADMFCCYAKDKEALEQFAVAFKEACENEALIYALFSKAILD